MGDILMHTCRICARQIAESLLDFGSHPIAHHYLSQQHTKAPVYPVRLYFCQGCGLIQLADSAPQETLYSRYFCLSSWKHQPHLGRIAELVDGLPGLEKSSRILELGSNDGIFLGALKRRGYHNLLGVEPAEDAAQAAAKNGIETLRIYFDLKAACDILRERGKFQLIVARQTLEHISRLKEFMQAICALLSPGGYIIIEVPDFSLNLAAPDYTIWEEHLNYFTPETLGAFLEASGFEIIHRETVLFSGRAMIAIGRYGGKGSGVPVYQCPLPLSEEVLAYQHSWPLFRRAFRDYLASQRVKAGAICLYGAGSRASSLINFTGIAPYIDFVADDQPEKQGKYMPGSRLPILPSSALEKERPGLCLLAVNAECEEKVVKRHPDFKGSFLSVLPPSEKLAPLWNFAKKGAACR